MARAGTFLILMLLILPCSLAQMHSPDKSKRQPAHLQKIEGSPTYAILNIGNVTAWVRYDGINFSPTSDNSVIFPRGTANVVYKDGFVWGAKAFLDAAHLIPVWTQPIRVGGTTYGTGVRAGYVTGVGAAAAPAPQTNPEVRIYRIRRDYFNLKNSNGVHSDELRRDAGEMNEISSAAVTNDQMENVYQQYETDWNQWPVQYGAPYIERNGIPGYQPPPPFNASFTADSLISGKYDEPGVSGPSGMTPADQVIWTVYNDLNESTTLGFAHSEPLGLEIQKTQWGYKSPSNLVDMYFVRYRILNKGGVDIDSAQGIQPGAFFLDSMYVSEWSDVDLGSFSDDLIGCDTTLNLGFVYNANDKDNSFQNFEIPPPSAGYRIAQGPMINAPSDSGVFDLRKRYGILNLPMTSFTYHSSGSPSDNFPPNNYQFMTGLWWKLLRGFFGSFTGFPLVTIDSLDTYFPHGPFPETRFPLSGDPVSGSGFIDGLGKDYSFIPGDRRLLVNSGPFSLAPGDTQEVIYSLVAGLGGDRLSSITIMKANAVTAGAVAGRLFEVPRPPAPPHVFATALNGEVILDWGSDLNAVGQTESPVIGGYKFEGYEVYQLPSSTSTLSEGRRIATFDVRDGTKRIYDEQFDSTAGILRPFLIADGTDSGVQRFLNITRDLLTDPNGNGPLRNGKRYYFAVTAYSYGESNPGLSPSYESEPVILTVQPEIPFGKTAPGKYLDTLTSVRISGTSDGYVVPRIIDPLAGTGDTYEVRFDDSGDTTTWSLTNITNNTMILTGQTAQADTESFMTVEGGVLLQVIGPPPGLKPNVWSWTGGYRFLTWAGGADGLGFEEFNGAVGWDSPRRRFGDGIMVENRKEPKKIEIRFAATTDSVQGTTVPTDPNISYGYRYLLNANRPAAQPAFAPYIVNPSGGYAYEDYSPSIPLAVYDVSGPVPRRLAVGYTENNDTAGTVNGRYWPPYSYDNADNTAASGPREWLFIFDEDYTGASPDSTYQSDLLTGPKKVMYWATWGRKVIDNWGPGNVMTLSPYRINTSSDVFQYTVPVPSTSSALQKASAERVGVFPNPYYGGRDQETTTWRHFVTFNNLPPNVTIRIFNLAGHLVRTLRKNDPFQFLEWDLTNEDRWAVASGMYICYVEMPDIGATKVLKLAVIQPQNLSPY